MTHTKGPWHTTVIDTINGAPAMWAICDIQKGFIATVDSVNEADARLIAAAPDLLAALETAVGCMKLQRDVIERGQHAAAWEHPIKAAESALARARGTA